MKTPLAARIETALRTLIAEVVRACRAAPGGDYSTEPNAWPPGASSRRMARDRIRAVPGHEQIGQGRATVWNVSAAAYQAHHARRVDAPAVDPSSDEALADAALAASGTRATRRAVMR